MVDNQAIVIPETIDAIRGKSADHVIEHAYRILSTLELAAYSLEELAEDVDDHHECGEEEPTTQPEGAN